MQNIQYISVPMPCNQSWKNMTLANKGRHCSQCSKTVTDFTKMTDNQIISYLAINSNICGKIDQQQLMAVNQQLLVEDVSLSGRFKGWVLAIGLLGSMSFSKANAQTKPIVLQTTETKTMKYYMPLTGISPPADLEIVKGIVLDDTDQPLPGALIVIGHTTVTQTDASGKFVIPKEFNIQQFKVSFIGYATQFISIENNTSFYYVKLKENAPIMGDIVVLKKPPFIKRTYNRYIRRPIYKFFK